MIFFFILFKLFIYEPPYEKTCLRGVRPGKTNRSAQQQKLAGGLKF